MIVDASVALKWSLQEADADLAERLFLYPSLAAPSVLPIEVGHILTKYVRRRVVTPADAFAIWLDLLRADMRIVDSTMLLKPALELSLRLGASFYDCIYLALAMSEDDVLVTADEHFIRTVRSAPDLQARIQSLAEAVT